MYGGARFVPSSYYPMAPRAEEPVEVPAPQDGQEEGAPPQGQAFAYPNAPHGGQAFQQHQYQQQHHYQQQPHGYQQSRSPVPHQMAPSPAVHTAVPAYEPEPVISSYAHGTDMPVAYYYTNIPTRRPQSVPASPVNQVHQEPQEPVYEEQQYHSPQGYQVQQGYPQQNRQHHQNYHGQQMAQGSRQVQFSVPPPQQRAPASPARRAPQQMMMEPSSYAYGQLNDTYSVINKPTQPYNRSSAYAPHTEKPIQEPVVEQVAAPQEPQQPSYQQQNYQQQNYQQQQQQQNQYRGTSSPYAQTMQSTQCASQTTPVKPAPVAHAFARPAPVQQAPSEHVAMPPTARYQQQQESTYIGGVPNDLVYSYQAKQPQYYYAQQHQQKVQQQQQQQQQQQPAAVDSIASAVTADPGPRAESPAPAMNMADMKSVVNEMKQMPGHAFTPLNVAPCSEYQFDQLQDLQSCV